MTSSEHPAGSGRDEPAKMQVDPADAAVDLDVMTLEMFEELDTPVVLGDEEAPRDLAVRIRLTGGLGRVVGPLGQPLLIDEVDTLEFTAIWPAVPDSDRGAALALLARWHDLNIPLRFLDFSTLGLLVEDDTHHLTVPPARRSLTLPDGDRVF